MLDTIAPAIRPSSLKLRRLYQDWSDRRRGREFPSRADFAPDDLKYVIGDLALIDVAYEPLRFQYRIYPSNLARRLGVELNKKNITEIPNPVHRSRAMRHFTEVLERRAPIAHYHDLELNTESAPHNCDILVLPLSGDGNTINMFMVGFEWDPGR
jgi:hypothetical protein